METCGFSSLYVELSQLGRALLMGVGLLTTAFVGMVSIWAARSSAGWFIRVPVLIGVVAAPVLVAGLDLAFVFLVHAILFFIVLSLLSGAIDVRRAKKIISGGQEDEAGATPRNVAFDKVVLVLSLIVTAIPLLASMPVSIWESWKYLVACGLVLALASLLAYWAAFIAKSTVSRLAVAIVFPVAFPMVILLSTSVGVCEHRRQNSSATYEGHEGATVVMRVWMYLTAILAVVTGVLVALVPAAAFLALLPRVWAVPAKTVNATGYDFLIAAGEALGDSIPDIEHVDEDGLRTIVLKQRQVVSDVRDMLLAVQLEAPPQLKYSAARKATSLRQVERALLAEERLAQMESRRADAAFISLDIVRLGESAARGGSVFDLLLGDDIQRTGLQRLRRAFDGLSVADRHHCAVVLQAVAMNEERLEQVIDRDWAWISRPFIWRGYLVQAILRVTCYEPPERTNLRSQYDLVRGARNNLIEAATTGRVELGGTGGRVRRPEKGAVEDSVTWRPRDGWSSAGSDG